MQVYILSLKVVTLTETLGASVHTREEPIHDMAEVP